MKDIVLAFPDVAAMAEFIIQHKVSNVETNSRIPSLKGVLSYKEILEACQSYDATIMELVGEMHYN